MPILGQHEMVEALCEAIDDRHHGVAVGNRKRAAGQKSFCTSMISSTSSSPGRICI
jgi:hypothetical protein